MGRITLSLRASNDTDSPNFARQISDSYILLVASGESENVKIAIE